MRLPDIACRVRLAPMGSVGVLLLLAVLPAERADLTAAGAAS